MSGKKPYSPLLFALTFCLSGFAYSDFPSPEAEPINEWQFVKGDLGGIWETLRTKKQSNNLPVWENVIVPHCYNAFDCVDPDKPYYQGPAWYRTQLKINNPYSNGRILIYFEGAGQKTDVYIDQKIVGSHIGGYDAFFIDITEAVQDYKKKPAFAGKDKDRFCSGGKVPLSIRCDNSRDLEAIPSDLSDFNLYGGLYRPVYLKYVPSISLERLHVLTERQENGLWKLIVKGRFYNPQLTKEALNTQVKILNPNGKICIESENTIKTATTELILLEQTIKNPLLWSPEDTNLYQCIVTIERFSGTSSEKVNFGFRWFEFAEKGPFNLNGKRLLLHGTHRHEDHAGLAAAMTDELIRKEIHLMKDMGVNFIRLGHYQQSEKVLGLCDELGILVWEEIPWCRGGLGGNMYKAQARNMLEKMIDQHRNHPSVIIWGLGNENDWPGDFEVFDKNKIRTFMNELNDLSHKLDPQRKTAIRRCEFCSDVVDIYSPSIWAGWYRGQFPEYKSISKKEMEKVNHFLHVEWGGDCHARRHAENPYELLTDVQTTGEADERGLDFLMTGGNARASKDGDWSESYICDLVDWHLKEQETMDWLTGTAFWIFKDFSTPLRPNNPVPFMNQKGAVERDLTPKEVYYVYQSYWAEKPMIRIYSHSWPVRWGKEAEKKTIKVYSNCTKVELFVNEMSMGTKLRNSQDFPAAGYRWSTPLNAGVNHIKAIGIKDGITVSDEISFYYETRTWGEGTKLVLREINRQDDRATIEAHLLDANNVICLDSREFVCFGLTGDGKLIDDLGTSTGSRKVQLYNGRAQIDVQLNNGKSVVSISCDKCPTEFMEI